MAIDPKLLVLKPVSELETVNNPTTGSLLFYDGGDKLKKTNVADFYNAMKSAYLGIATTNTTPPATGAYWYKVDTAGTYTNFLSGGSPVVVTEGDFYDGTKYYDVTIEVKDNVATKRVRAIPMPPVTGIVEEGNTQAVSGGEVYNLKEDIINDYIGTRGQLVSNLYSYNPSAVSDSLPSYSYLSYINQNDLIGKLIDKVTVTISQAGTFTIMKVINYGTVDQVVTYSKTFNVVLGKNVLNFNQVLKHGERIAFMNDSDTAIFKFTTSDTSSINSFYGKFKPNGNFNPSNNILNIGITFYDKFYKISDKIESFEKVNNNYINETIPYSLGNKNSISTYYRYFTYNNQDLIRNKIIKSLKINISKAGTFSVMKGKNINKPTLEITDVETFNTTNGINILHFSSDVVLENDEFLVFCKETDTALFLHKDYESNKKALGFSYQEVSSGNWTSALMGDLCIGVYTEELSIAEKVLSSKKIRKISFLGDSITTFAGYIVSGNATWYPTSDVNSVDKTWWYRLANELGLYIEVNNSFSGAKISGTDSSAYHNRVTNIGNPDVCLIFGGTNDYAEGVPLGDWNFTNTTFDVTVFKQALQKLLHTAITSKPLVKFYYIVPLYTNYYGQVNGFPTNYNNTKFLRDYQNAIIEACTMYGVEIIDARFVISQYNANELTTDGLHPNALGMNLLKDFVKKRIT